MWTRENRNHQHHHQHNENNNPKHTQPSRMIIRCILLIATLLPTQGFVPLYKNKGRTPVSLHVTKAEAPSTRESALTLLSLEELNSCKSGVRAQRLLERELFQESNGNKSPLYKSISIPAGASAKGLSDGDLAIQTRLVNKRYKIMELIELSGDRDADRASLALASVMVASTLSALVANQNLPGPDIIRFIVVWVFSFAPLAFVGAGINDAEQLQAFLVSIQRQVFPAYRQRMVQHEAGHFLMAHLLGWPIAGYSANAVKNAVEFYPLSDTERGSDYAARLGFERQRQSDNEAETPLLPILEDRQFFSKGGRGGKFVEERSVFRNVKNYTDNPFLKLQPKDDPTQAWPFRGFDDRTLDQIAVISVAGVCAEILAFGNAEGGLADFNQLKQIFNAAEEGLTDRDIENRIRYALGYTMSQLRRHLGALDALAKVMERGGSIAECVLVIETCENVSGQDGIMGDYELRRRAEFRSKSAGWFETLLLGKQKTIDDEENRLVEGKGGGYRKETYRLTGDDPLYAALAVALGFLLWASSGGLTLH